MIVIFDLDGPILDVSAKYYQLYADLLLSAGASPLPKERYWQLKRARISEKEIFRQSGVGDPLEKLLGERLARIESPDYLRYDQVQVGMIEALAALSREHELVLATMRRSRENLEWELGHLGLARFFSAILSSSPDNEGDDHAQVKADLVRHYFGCDRLRGWFIGDTATDIKAGKILGVDTAAVGYGIRTAEELQACQPTLMFDDPIGMQCFLVELATGTNARDGVRA